MLSALLLLASQIEPVAAEKPNRQPQLAAHGSTVGVAYGAGNTIYFAASKDSGRTFGAPVIVSSAGQLSLGMHRGPRVAYTAYAIVLSAVVGDSGHGKDGDVMAWRSRDGGATWSGPVRVNDVAGSAREGLHGMASGGKDVLFAAWLDLREKGTRIYGARSSDAGATWSTNHLVYESPSGTVCQCCHPSVAIDARGVIHVMFRNALDGSRDMYAARSQDGGRTFGAARKLGLGTWKLDACPMDGGGLAVDSEGQVTTVWRRDSDLFATDGHGPERSLGPGKNATVTTGRGGAYVAWTQGGAVLVRKPRLGPETVDAGGAFPSLVALDDGSVVVAWESKGSVVIHAIQ